MYWPAAWRMQQELQRPFAASIPVFYIGRVVSLGIINFIISIPVCYFVLVDGENFVESIISPTPRERNGSL